VLLTSRCFDKLLVEELPDAEIDLAREFRVIDVEGLRELCFRLCSRTPVGDQLPEARRRGVERIDPVRVEVDEHDLVVNSARHDIRVGHEISPPGLRPRGRPLLSAGHEAAEYSCRLQRSVLRERAGSLCEPQRAIEDPDRDREGQHG
jgi:hypothetical protein